MPQRLDDLHLLAPPRDDIDDVLVERWNRVTEVWRNEVEFRTAVLHYATTNAYRDPASAALWPEVVYPLIERARWHRRIRPRTEAVWDYVCGRCAFPMPASCSTAPSSLGAGPAVRADSTTRWNSSIDSPRLDDADADPFAAAATTRPTACRLADRQRVSLAEPGRRADRTRKGQGLAATADPDPLRFFQGQLHELWKEALAALQQQAQPRPGAKPATHRHVPVGPYRLIVIPSIRGRAAGQIAIQGMTNKQIELSTPTVRTKAPRANPRGRLGLRR